MKGTILKCDVCKSQEKIKPKKMQMVRHFDSNDGRSFYNHFSSDVIDLCDKCFDATLKSGKYLIDERVMGHGNIILID